MRAGRAGRALGGLWFAAALLVGSRATAARELVWRPGAAGAAQARQFVYSQTDGSALRGSVAWDPCLYLRLPAGGVDAALHYLEVRLYSSAPADLLDVYYQAPGGDWGLMGRHAIRRGWATYRMDLASLTAHECGGSAASRRWGGAPQRIISFRIDPGNEADRWVVVSRVRLTDQPLADGVTSERRGRLRSTRVQAPRAAMAGGVVRVTAFLGLGDVRPGGAAATAWVRLMRGGVPLADREAPLRPVRGRATVSVSFPTSRYLAAGALTARAGAYELDDPPGGFAAARIALRNPREGTLRPPAVSVRRVAGDPTLCVEGRPVPAMAFLVGTGRQAALHREFAAAGIHLYTDWFGGSGSGDLGHSAPGVYDYGAFDAYFADILDADPQARFIPHLYVTPPAWWQKAHPEELCRFADGGSDCQSFASERWRRDVGDDLRRLIAHLQSTSYADRILGYILCSGHTAEWQQWGVWGDRLADYSEPSRAAFRRWLATRYGTDAGLRAAWRRSDVSLAGAELPAAAERGRSAAYLLRDPAVEQPVIDLYRFQSETIADAIRHFARVVKRASRGRSLAGAYYGYLTQHGMHQQDSGHLALARLLDAPEIDFLMSPPMYTGREAGGTSAFMSAVASAKLHGKLWLNESDIRTHLSDPGAGFGRTANMAESRAVLRREFGEMLARRTALSWFDMDGGWFSHPRILADMAAMRRLAGRALGSRRPYRPQIAVFISAEAAYRAAPSEAWVPAVLTPVVELPRVGAPADVYLLSDINRPDFPNYRVYVFLNAWYVDPATRRSIDARVKRKGATAVWVFAPGIVTDSGLSPAAMRALTGIGLRFEMRSAVQQVRLAPDAAPVGWDRPLGPVVRVDDPEAEVLASEIGGGSPGLVRKRMPGWTSIYLAGVGMPPPLLRRIARDAGVHVYLDTDDALDTDGEWVCIHARSAGAKLVRLPAPRRVVDAMTGRLLAAHTVALTLDLKAHETALLRLQEPAARSSARSRRRSAR